MNTPYAPIVVFCYKRVDTLKKCISSLQENELFSESPLFIFSDGARSAKDVKRVQDVRDYLYSVKGSLSVSVIKQEVNIGLANSIINGVDMVLKQYGRAIVVEDDLIVSSNFLDFMNQALNFYQEDKGVHSISGFSPTLKFPKGYHQDFYFSPRSTSWGWGTWRDRWVDVDWDLVDIDLFFKDQRQVKQFNRYGSNFSSLLKKQLDGKIDSWAIRWCYDQFKRNRCSVFPTKSKVMNIGFGADATHTGKNLSYFTTILDSSGKRDFIFERSTIGFDDNILRLISQHYGVFSRLMVRFKSLFAQ